MKFTREGSDQEAYDEEESHEEESHEEESCEKESDEESYEFARCKLQKLKFVEIDRAIEEEKRTLARNWK